MTSKIYLSIIFGSFVLFVQAQNIENKTLDSYLESLATHDKFMGSVSILNDGKLVYNKTVGYSSINDNKMANNETKYKIGSISKVFTAVLILKAIEEKKLNLNTKLSQFYPEIKEADNISIQNLLNHSSGIYSITDEADYLEWHTQKMSEKDFLNKLKSNASLFNPNSKNEYSNSNYILLSYILEKIYQTNYEVLLDKQIIQKLQLKNTYFGDKIVETNAADSYVYDGKWIKHPKTHPSVPLGAGAITSNTNDLVAFIYSLFNHKIINEHNLKLMTTIEDGYGLGIFDFTHNDNLGFGHDGAIDGFKSLVVMYPNIKTAYAITSNANNYNINLVSKTIESAIFNEKIEIPNFTKIAFSLDELEKFTGTFAAAEMPFKIKIAVDNMGLIAEATGQSALSLDAIDKNIFTFDKAGIKLTFKDEGHIMILSQSGREIEMKKE